MGRLLPQGTYQGPLVLMTAFGIWATVPENNSARVLLAASILLALATGLGMDARLTSAGAFAFSGLVAWIGATRAEALHGAIIGALACFGILVLLPAFTYDAGRVQPRTLLVANGA